MSTERNEKQMTKERKIMKRKILAIMLSSMLAFSFTACGNTEETADGTVTNAEADVDVTDTGTDVENDAAENDAADIVVDTEAADAQSEDVETDSTEDLFCMLDVPILEMPDLAGTTWSFCGGNLGGVQMTQDDYDAALEQYGGNWRSCLAMMVPLYRWYREVER